jgi:hypothetical protein
MPTTDLLTKSKTNFALQEMWRLQEKGITVEFSPTPTVKYANTECNGYFVDEPKAFLTVATGKDINEWFPVFVHESCHADQYLQKAPCWNTKIGGYEPMAILDLWLDHNVELNPEQLNRTIQSALLIELDCEQRVVAKYEKYSMPFDKDEYIQKANSYVYFYLVMMHTRKWYAPGCAPYSLLEVWSNMPKEFQTEYTSVEKYLHLFKPCYGPETIIT